MPALPAPPALQHTPLRAPRIQLAFTRQTSPSYSQLRYALPPARPPPYLCVVPCGCLDCQLDLEAAVEEQLRGEGAAANGEQAPARRRPGGRAGGRVGRQAAVREWPSSCPLRDFCWN